MKLGIYMEIGSFGAHINPPGYVPEGVITIRVGRYIAWMNV